MKHLTSLPQGVAWSMASRVGAQVIQFAASLVIARLVAPEAFGLVGMVATVTGFLGLFIDAGFGTALVQRKDVEPAHVEGAFTATVVIGAVTAAVLALSAPLVARFYGPGVLTDITRVNAITVLLGSAAVVPRALLVRGMRLGTLAALELGSVVISTSVSLALAVGGAGVWALVVPGIATSGVTLVAIVAAAHWRPRFGPWSGARPLLGVGLNLLAFNVVNYCGRTADNVLIGVWIGERELGLYLRAYGLMLLPVTEITAVLSSAVLPALARLQDDHAAVKSAFLKAVGIVGLVSLPATVGLSLVAEPLVTMLYGPAWTEVAPILQVLAIVGAIQSIMSPLGWIYMSVGRTDRMFRWGLLASAIFVAFLAYGAWLGSALNVARLYLVANVVLFTPAYAYAGRTIGLRVRDLVPFVLPTLAATAVMAICVATAGFAVRGAPTPARLALQVAAGIASFVVGCRLVRNRAALDAAALVLELHPGWRRWVQPLALLLVRSHDAGARMSGSI